MLVLALVMLVFGTACSRVPRETTHAGPDTGSAEQAVSLTIDVRTLLVQTEQLDPAKLAYVPNSGYILQDEAVEYEAGLTAFDALLDAAEQHQVAVDYRQLGSAYIDGIGQIYAGDCGAGSGWLYAVNGESPGQSAGNVELEPGDEVAWVYTCDMGRDVGLE